LNFERLGFGEFAEKGGVIGGENFYETGAGMREVEKAVV